MAPLEDVFKTGNGKRDNFLSRLFGIFNEEVVRYWCANPNSPFADLGRPTLYTPDGRRYTLDFTFRDLRTGKTFVTEMKCELAYDGHRFLRLKEARQIDHHTTEAFKQFLTFARPGHSLSVKIAGESQQADGAILVWGATTPEGVASVRLATGVTDVLSVESMIDDLRSWNDAGWRGRISELNSWCNALFEALQPQPT